MDLDQKSLIKKAIGGNSNAKRALYEYHEKYWFRLCLRYAKNRSEAQDVFQEGVIKLFEVLGKYKVESNSFQAWSNKVIVNAVLKYLKKHHWKQTMEDLDKIEEMTQFSESAIEKLSSQELIAIIQKLPSGYRTVFNMYEMEGYTHKEIAEALDISIGTSKSQLSKAKKLLRRQLEVLFK